MTLQALCIKDLKADCYTAPSFHHTLAIAVRQFYDLALDPNHPIGQHPEDYMLIHIGNWDDTTGKFTNEGPNLLAHATDTNGKGKP